MEGKVLARIAAVVFAAILLTLTVIGMLQEETPPRPTSAPAASVPADPLRERQRRCQQMGEAAAADADCLATWAETRDRFLGRDPVQPAGRREEGR